MTANQTTAIDRAEARYAKASAQYDKLEDKSGYAAAGLRRKMRTELVLARYLRRG
jgi:hypothetical protein